MKRAALAVASATVVTTATVALAASVALAALLIAIPALLVSLTSHTHKWYR